VIHRVAKPSPPKSSMQEAAKNRNLRYPIHVLRTLRPIFRTHSNPMFQNMSTHDPNAKTYKLDTWKPTFRVQEDPRSRRVEISRSGQWETHVQRINSLLFRKKKTDFYSYYKYQHASKYTLFEIIPIKALIHIFSYSPKN
jgi:hypothetical protein